MTTHDRPFGVNTAPLLERTVRSGDTVPEALLPSIVEPLAGPAAWEVEVLEGKTSSADNYPADDAVHMWLREVGRTPLLSHREEVIIARRIERGVLAAQMLRDTQRDLASGERASLMQQVDDGTLAKEHLVCANLRLVVAVAKRYVGRGLTLGDLIQEGNLGLLRTIEKYDYRRGYKFSTYATWWIRQSITRAIADHGRTIRVPVHMVESINKVMRTQNTLGQRLCREATLEEIAEELDLTVERVREVIRISPEPMSLETPLGDDEEAHLSDFLVDHEAEAPSEVITQRLLRDQLESLMRDVLSEREKEVLWLRYGLADGSPRTLEEVGNAVGVTRERIRQIEARAMKKLRHPSRSGRLREILD